MKNRSLEYWVGALFLVLLINTGYIAAIPAATVFYMTNVLGHLVLGAVLAIALIFILRKTGLPAGAPVAVGFLLTSFVFGVVLAYAGNVHDNSWMLWSHIVAAVIGGVEALGLIGDRLGLEGGGWSFIAMLNQNFGTLGYLIVGIFALCWLVSAAIYRIKRFDDMEIGMIE